VKKEVDMSANDSTTTWR